MKKFGILLASLILCCWTAQSQNFTYPTAPRLSAPTYQNLSKSIEESPTSKNVASTLPRFGEMVKSYGILATIRGVRSYSEKDDYIPISDMKYLTISQYTNICKSTCGKYEKLSKYITPLLKHRICSFYNNIGYIEDVTVVKAKMCPDFAVNSANDTCVYVGSFSLDVTFNTLRTSETERAKTAIERVILPIIQKTIDDLVNIGHQYIMIGVGYGIRDFSESYGDEGACVMCIFSISDLKDFADLELSQEELLHKSSVYLRDTGEIKKVSL